MSDGPISNTYTATNLQFFFILIQFNQLLLLTTGICQHQKLDQLQLLPDGTTIYQRWSNNVTLPGEHHSSTKRNSYNQL